MVAMPDAFSNSSFNPNRLMTVLQSQLLVASPKLPDDNFFKTVIYIIHHDDKGAFGIVLNRPTSYRLKEVWHAITDTQLSFDAPLYRGGPVEGPLIAVHDRAECGESEIFPGTFMSSQRSSLEVLLDNPSDKLRIFSGYSGWGAGQLENELEYDSWFLTPALGTDLFAEPEELWTIVAARIADQIVHQTHTKPAVSDSSEPSLQESENSDSALFTHLSLHNDAYFLPNASKIWLN